MASKGKKPHSDQKPKFERRDVVRLIGIPSPLMLVISVAGEPEEENEEFTVNVLYFKGDGTTSSGEYGDSEQYEEGLLQLVKPAAQVVAEAEAASREARGSY